VLRLNCSMAAGEPGNIRPGGLVVRLFNDKIFEQLRAFAQVPDNFVDTGWGLDTLKAGGGKGGTAMARVGSSYIVKELSEGDHKTLLRLTGSYGTHVRNGDTLLSPIYLHFQDTATGRLFFVMRNAIGGGSCSQLYDLKGCADDKAIFLDGKEVPPVHKRIWNVGMWLSKSGWTEERHRYYDGKCAAYNVSIVCTPDQRSRLLGCIRRDVDWLQKNRLMDYSLLVATKPYDGSLATRGLSPSTLGHGMLLKRPDDGKEELLYVSIIDFLATWTCQKRIAKVIKTFEQNKATVPPGPYGERFFKHFEMRFKGEAKSLEAPHVSSSSVPRPVAPPAGDTEMEGSPEDRLQTPVTSRPQVEERLNSRSRAQVLAPSPEEPAANTSDAQPAPQKRTMDM